MISYHPAVSLSRADQPTFGHPPSYLCVPLTFISRVPTDTKMPRRQARKLILTASSYRVVPYAAPGWPHPRKFAFDVGEYGLGVLCTLWTELREELVAPENATRRFWD